MKKAFVENKNKISPKVKDILELLGKGALLSSLFLFPGAAIGIQAIYDEYEKLKREKEFHEWEKFNLSRLHYILRRLQRQNIVKIVEKDGLSEVHLTQKGRLRILKYKLEEMSIDKPKQWDKKWRIIIYDISKFKRRQQNSFRRMLKKLKLLQLQKSVYLTPYSCNKEIEFLRQYFDVGEGVLYIIAEHIENEGIYKKFFGL